MAQLNLFDYTPPQKNSAALMEAIDKLNNSGKGKLWFAGQGIEKNLSYEMGDFFSRLHNPTFRITSGEVKLFRQTTREENSL